MTRCLSIIAGFRTAGQDFRRALNHVLEALRLCKVTHNQDHAGLAHKVLGDIYAAMGLQGMAVRAYRTSGILCAESSGSLADQADISTLISKALRNASEIRCKACIDGDPAREVEVLFLEGLGTFYAAHPGPFPRAPRYEMQIESDGFFVIGGRRYREIAEHFVVVPDDADLSACAEVLPLVLRDRLPAMFPESDASLQMESLKDEQDGSGTAF
jgi:hypothetical protein